MPKGAESCDNVNLNTILHIITNRPQNILCFFLVFGAVLISMVSLIVGIVLFLMIRLTRIPIWIVSLLSVVLIVGAWITEGLTLNQLMMQNSMLIAGLSQGDFGLLKIGYTWLSAIPYGVLLGGLGALLVDSGSHLQQELKRVSKGRLQMSEKPLRQKKIQRMIKRLESSACAHGSILGVDRMNGHPVQLSDADANLHTLAIGTTGSGKTTGLSNVIESAICRHLPLIYLDGKGDLALAHAIRHYAQSQEVPFYLFSMVGNSLKYNPISFGGYTSKKDRIIELRTWTEDHYRKLAEGYLQTVFKIVDKAKINIDLHSLANYLEPDALYLLARNLGDQSLVKEIESIERKRKDIESLIAEIENMVNSEIGHLFDCSSGDVMTLDRVLNENAVAYFCLQPLAFPAYAETLGKLIINDIKALLGSQLLKQDKIKLFTIFDEFSIFAGDQILNLINQGRGAGVHAILSTQSLSDILRKGDNALLGQTLNNTNNYIIQRQNNPDDAEILANIIGTKDGFQVTSQISANESGAEIGSVRESKEFIVHPDEIKRLGMGQAIYVNKQNFNVQRVQLRKGAI